MDCFDVDLDSVSADQAALLAEKMLAMISLGPPNELTTSASPPASSPRGVDHSVSRNLPPSDSVVVKQENDDDNHDDERTQPRQDHIRVKAEPPSSIDLFFSGPTQERASQEANVVICGTFLSPQKKVWQVPFDMCHYAISLYTRSCALKPAAFIFLLFLDTDGQCD